MLLENIYTKKEYALTAEKLCYLCVEFVKKTTILLKFENILKSTIVYNSAFIVLCSV